MKEKQVTTMNKTMKTVITALAVAFLGCGVLCEQTQAAGPITGDIGFFGSATASGASPGSPVTISFTNPGWEVLSVSPGSTYDLGGAVFGTPATFTNFSFTGDGVTAALTAPTLPEWSFSLGGIDYSFDLLSLTNGHTEGIGGVGAMSFSGLGTVHATGFDDMPATWSLQGSGEGFNFILSGSTTASVPEGGVMSLLGLGFAILAGKSLLRKRKTV
jgi:hypothetical protein